jgi:hypothetical protein
VRSSNATALLTVVALLTGPNSATAQPASGLSATLAFGATLGSGGDYYERRGIAAVAAVAGAVRRATAGTLSVGVSASILGNPDAGLDDCLLVPGRTTCLPRLPLFVGVAPELGWILGGRGASILFMGSAGAGPYWANGEANPVLAAHLQLGLARRLGPHWALSLAGRATTFPRVDNRSVLLGSLLAGVRWSRVLSE